MKISLASRIAAIIVYLIIGLALFYLGANGVISPNEYVIGISGIAVVLLLVVILINKREKSKRHPDPSELEKF